ncbi:MAG: hypothetical protein OEU36_04515, partial [Gammaproteobacteria bacterium]|nr:hypothetical protein [Gammaproteobacteria bacterium]
MIDLIFIALGLLGLWLGTELVIKGAVNIAHHYRLSELFVGLTILSIGSDLPELAVAVNAGIRTSQGFASSGVVVGTSIGSAFGQIGLVLGVAGLAGYLTVARRYVYRHGTALLGSIVLLMITGWDGHITPKEGIVLLIGFTVYFVLLLMEEQTQHKNGTTNPETAAMLLAIAGRRYGDRYRELGPNRAGRDKSCRKPWCRTGISLNSYHRSW